MNQRKVGKERRDAAHGIVPNRQSIQPGFVS